MNNQRSRKNLIAFYFGSRVATKRITCRDSVKAVSRRAYLDLCRTMHGIGNFSGAEKLRVETHESVVRFLEDCAEIATQLEFDRLHESWCSETLDRFGDLPRSVREVRYGQAQKWVNMVMKYLAVLEHPEAQRLYPHLHVPIDSIVYSEARKIGVEEPGRTGWSRLSRDQYTSYQQSLRERIKECKGDGCAPLDWESDVWVERASISG